MGSLAKSLKKSEALDVLACREKARKGKQYILKHIKEGRQDSIQRTKIRKNISTKVTGWKWTDNANKKQNNSTNIYRIHL